MRAGVLIASTAMLLISAQPVKAEISQGLPLEIKATRVLIEGKQRQSFWTVKNHAKQSFAFTIFTYDTNERLDQTERSKNFIVTPPTGLLNPNEEKTFRIVRVGDHLPSDRESLALLRLKLLPSGQQPNQANQARIQSLMSIYLKLFYRPEGLVKAFAVENSIQQLKAHCQGGLLTIENPSSYWLTLDSVKVNKIDLITQQEKAPMIGPRAHWSRLVSLCPRHVEVNSINESGFPTPFQLLNVEGLK